MARNLDLSLVRTFVTVVDRGGMTGAGRVLGLTQAAVSQQIKRLEDMLELILFEREGRGLRLTPAGERLLPHGRRLLAVNDEVWGLMTAPDFEGEIRLGVPHDIIATFVPPILKAFDQTWPRVRISMVSNTTTRLLKQLERGEIDLTLTTEETTQPGGELLLRDALVWVGAPGGRSYAREPLPLSLGDPTCMFRKAALGALAEMGRDWRSVCEVSEMEALIATIRADLAVMALLESTLPAGLEVLGPANGLPLLPGYMINLYVHPRGDAEIVDELVRHVREHFSLRAQHAA